jgi:hypothetical protein
MNVKSLKAKLELYYDKIQNPDKVIDNWAIIDIKLLNSLKKIKLNNINNISRNIEEKIINVESKNKYIAIKVSFNFIAIKIIDNEYDYILKDWDLIAVDKEFVYKGKATKPMSNKQIIKLLGFKLSSKAKKDLEYFS